MAHCIPSCLMECSRGMEWVDLALLDIRPKGQVEGEGKAGPRREEDDREGGEVPLTPGQSADQRAEGLELPCSSGRQDRNMVGL